MSSLWISRSATKLFLDCRWDLPAIDHSRRRRRVTGALTETADCERQSRRVQECRGVRNRVELHNGRCGGQICGRCRIVPKEYSAGTILGTDAVTLICAQPDTLSAVPPNVTTPLNSTCVFCAGAVPIAISGRSMARINTLKRVIVVFESFPSRIEIASTSPAPRTLKGYEVGAYPASSVKRPSWVSKVQDHLAHCRGLAS